MFKNESETLIRKISMWFKHGSRERVDVTLFLMQNRVRVHGFVLKHSKTRIIGHSELLYMRGKLYTAT